MTSPSAIDTTPAGCPAAPRVLCDAPGAGRGPRRCRPACCGSWRRADVSSTRTWSGWRPGSRITAHTEAQLDVLVLVVAGDGTLGDGTPDAAEPLAAGALVWLPHGAPRSITAGEAGLTYLTVHNRRPGMRIGSRPTHVPSNPRAPEAGCAGRWGACVSTSTEENAPPPPRPRTRPPRPTRATSAGCALVLPGPRRRPGPRGDRVDLGAVRENDGRGKDRPVLVVAREAAGTFLAVQLTSKRHDRAAGDAAKPRWVAIGSGPWDRSGRDSWVDVDRVLRLHEEGMRREACALDRMRFDLVRRRLHERYGWT